MASSVFLAVFSHIFVKTLPMLISGFAIYLGYRLFILGVTGKASIVVNADEISGQLINAAPGLFFAVGGIAALITCVVSDSTLRINEKSSPKK